jgi:hypothetical protein
MSTLEGGQMKVIQKGYTIFAIFVSLKLFQNGNFKNEKNRSAKP